MRKDIEKGAWIFSIGKNIISIVIGGENEALEIKKELQARNPNFIFTMSNMDCIIFEK